MKHEQMSALNAAGIEMLNKSRAVTNKLADATRLAELGMKLLAEAREIFDDIQRNSVWLFVECCTQVRKEPGNYPAYLDFCARNGLEIVSETDFKPMLAEINDAIDCSQDSVS